MFRNLLLSLTLVVFTLGSMFSQVTAGFKAGINIADVNGLEFTTDGSNFAEGISNSIEGKRTSYFVGFLVDIPISEKLSFTPEFIYSQQGKDREEFRIDYLNLPLGLKYTFNKLYVSAGPQVGVRVWTPEQSSVFANFDASVFGNIGYTFGSNFFVEARYSFGVTDIFQDNNNFRFNGSSSTVLSNLEGRNAVIQIGIGYKI